jgi:hypothetical protein
MMGMNVTKRSNCALKMCPNFWPNGGSWDLIMMVADHVGAPLLDILELTKVKTWNPENTISSYVF